MCRGSIPIAALVAVPLLTSLLTATPQTAAADPVVVPNGLTHTFGNTFGGWLSYPDTTFQQVYSASSLADTPVWVNGMAFRPPQIGAFPFRSEVPAVEVRLSTTAVAPDQLSVDLPSNVGRDAQLVYTGPFVFTPPAGDRDDTGHLPATTSFVYPLPTFQPFLYDPRAGNLLLEIQLRSAPIGSPDFDIQWIDGDEVSVAMRSVLAGSSVTESWGLVTRFDLTEAAPVPEPSSVLVIATGAVVLGLRRRRQNSVGARDS